MNDINLLMTIEELSIALGQEKVDKNSLKVKLNETEMKLQSLEAELNTLKGEQENESENTK